MSFTSESARRDRQRKAGLARARQKASGAEVANLPFPLQLATLDPLRTGRSAWAFPFCRARFRSRGTCPAIRLERGVANSHARDAKQGPTSKARPPDARGLSISRSVDIHRTTHDDKFCVVGVNMLINKQPRFSRAKARGLAERLPWAQVL